MQKIQSSKLEIIYTGTNLNIRQIIVILSNILCLIAWSVTRLYVLATGQ